jgi:hypothetical protein
MSTYVATAYHHLFFKDEWITVLELGLKASLQRGDAMPGIEWPQRQTRPDAPPPPLHSTVCVTQLSCMHGRTHLSPIREE